MINDKIQNSLDSGNNSKLCYKDSKGSWHSNEEIMQKIKNNKIVMENWRNVNEDTQ